MADYKLSIKTSAGKELNKIDAKADRVRIVERIFSLSQNPRPHGAEKLVG